MNLTVTLRPGPHDRIDCPVEIPLPDGAPNGTWTLTPGNIPAQSAHGWLRFIIPQLGAGQALDLSAKPADQVARVTVTEAPGVLEFKDGAEIVTRYNFDSRGPLPVPARPYFSPTNLGGLNLTREVPPKTGQQPKDHPHHKGLWVAYGDVGGSDLWSDEEGHGDQKHLQFDWSEGGPVCAEFEERLLWESGAGMPLLDEVRIFRLWKSTGNVRMMDLESRFSAGHGSVRLGDTKEGGFCAVRVKEPLQGDKDGLIRSANGALTEAENWGQRSEWVDYAGTLEGKKVGIAILDHPRAFRYPSHWHVRDYGLFAANPMALRDYQSGHLTDGSHVVMENESISFKYRVILHDGDANTARIQARWLDFAHPPSAGAHPDD